MRDNDRHEDDQAEEDTVGSPSVVTWAGNAQIAEKDRNNDCREDGPSTDFDDANRRVFSASLIDLIAQGIELIDMFEGDSLMLVDDAFVFQYGALNSGDAGNGRILSLLGFFHMIGKIRRKVATDQ